LKCGNVVGFDAKRFNEGLRPRLAGLDQELLRAPQQLDHGLHAAEERLTSVNISRHDPAAISTLSRLSRLWAVKSLVIWQPRDLRWGMQDRAGRENACWRDPRRRIVSRAQAAPLGRLMALKGEARLPLV